MNQSVTTDWTRVREAFQANAPVCFDPETDPYDPNNEAAVLSYWQAAKITKSNGSSVAIKRPVRRAIMPPAIAF